MKKKTICKCCVSEKDGNYICGSCESCTVLHECEFIYFYGRDSVYHKELLRGNWMVPTQGV